MNATENTFDLDDYRNAESLREVWDTLTSPVLFVLDHNGVNMEGAKVRHLYHDTWIYVDGVDGYTFIDEASVAKLDLTTEDTGNGYQPDGSVINTEGDVVFSPED